MKLTENNINFVKELTEDGITYAWFVSLKSKNVCDSRNFINYENGKTVVREYKKEDLPKTVQNFISKHNRKVFEQVDEIHTRYIYE